MDTILRRGMVAELLGTFALVYFGAGAVCVNYLASTAQTPLPGTVNAMQPGLLGVALAQGLIFAAVLAVTARVSGSYLNPAVTLMLWVFNRLDNKRMAVFLSAQLAGGLLAGASLRFTFEESVLREARMGTPHLNPLAFPSATETSRTSLPALSTDPRVIIAGTAAELVLTFFLVFAIFGAQGEGRDPSRAAVPAGLILVAGAVVIGPLTGAAANPARWFGTVLWEQLLPDRAFNPWNDTFVYLAGPILGALAAGLITFRFLLNEAPVSEPARSTFVSQPVKAPPAAPVKRK
jgi:glycerol uptake facilitator protein